MAFDHWTWETGTPRERADMVRAHARNPKFTRAGLAHLFGLSPVGLVSILAGNDWRPEYDAPSPTGKEADQ